MTPQTRMLVMRDLTAERVFARCLFPMGEKGLQIKNGVVTPSEQGWRNWLSEHGAAARPGDRVVISNVVIKEKSIVLEINGGPKKKEKWYQHIQVGVGGTMATVRAALPRAWKPRARMVTLEFDKYVPELTGDQVRDMLSPVFDFKALNQAEAYEKTLPPKVQEAIKNHKVLVGMDRDMVIYAKGRPPKKIRDKDDKGQDYEEWIYGNPPEEVEFVRFQGEVVARLEIMTVDGEKIVRTEKEVDLQSAETEVAAEEAGRKPANAPSAAASRRAVENAPQASDRRSPTTPYPPPGSTPTTGPDGLPPHQLTAAMLVLDRCRRFGAPAARALYTVKVRIALGQINTTVGDFPGNSAKIIEYAQRARSAGADLILFPELCVCGYPPRDLVERPWFVERNRQSCGSDCARDRRASPSSAVWSLPPIPPPASR